MRISRFRPAGNLLAAALVGLTAGCGESSRASGVDRAARSADTLPVASLASSRHVDSILPLNESIRRFRGGLAPVAALSGGAGSRAGLVRAFLRAVERSDTATIRRLVLGSAEFAYLYYPSSPLAAPPYSQPPGLLWMQIQLNSEKGIVRVLRRYGGHALSYGSHRCAAPRSRPGENRLWEGCTLRLAVDGGNMAEKRLFGTILERGGRFKFVSYANDF